MTREYKHPIQPYNHVPDETRPWLPTDGQLVSGNIAALAERVEAVVDELERLNDKFFAGPEYRVT